jgi:shikimate kinase
MDHRESSYNKNIIYAGGGTVLNDKNYEPIPFVGWVEIETTNHLARVMDQARHLAQLAKQVEDYSELVYEATKLEQRIKEYEQNR